MPLTSQIIAEIVRREVGAQLEETNRKIDQLAAISSQKLDNLSSMLTESMASSVRIDRDQAALIAQTSDLKKRVEKLEAAG